MSINSFKFSVKFLAVMVLISATISAPAFASAAAPGAREPLKLISSRDNLPGSFTTSQSVYATEKNIYLVSSQGSLFVLKRSKAQNFPLIQTLNLGVPLTSVRGYGSSLFVATADGYLRQYSTTNPLTLVRSVQLATYGLGSIAIVNNTVYVSRGQAALAVDSNNVYLAQLNEGDVAFELNSQLAVTKTYGANTFEPDVTVVFNRTTGSKTTAIANPITLLNIIGLPALFAFNDNLFQTVPGCCGAGVVITPTQMLTTPRVISEYFVNTVTLDTKGLVTGGESGRVSVYKFTSTSIQKRKTLDLPQLTNHTNPEDIEIRALWSDNYDNLVFAASSWGNTTTQSPSLPSLFVLELQ